MTAENRYQGIYVTETILGNPNGSFINNEPRNIDGRVYTTDKCIKYNIRQYIHNYKENVDAFDNFVFFYPRKVKGSGTKSEYKTKEDVFEEYLEKDPDKLIECPDVRMFGGTFSFRGEDDQGHLFGPIQLSFGLDMIGAEIVSMQLGTPFANKTGKQKTIGEKYVVDHAVIAYDISINPMTAIDNDGNSILRDSDIELFKEGIIHGTNDRVSTSKTTKSKLLLMVKFSPNFRKNIGDLKRLSSVKSDKVNLNNGDSLLKLDLGMVAEKLSSYKDSIEQISIERDVNVKLLNFTYSDIGVDEAKLVTNIIGSGE